jgi:hypothetical protein
MDIEDSTVTSICAAACDRLEGTDRLPELLALLAVLDRQQHPFAGPQRISSHQNGCPGSDFAEDRGGIDIESARWDTVEVEIGDIPRIQQRPRVNPTPRPRCPPATAMSRRCGADQ